MLPEVDVWPSYLEVKLGDHATFTCKADSKYPVTVYWVRADKARFGNNHVVKDNVLTIRNVRRKDQGTYVCLATNRFGSSKATADLEIN